MRTNLKYITFLFLLGLVLGCKKNETAVDKEYPTIDVSAATAFPIQCSEITRGQKFTFKAKFTDNAALGSYSLDIHHNFDHHSHSTEVSDCSMAPVKAAVKPFLFINTFQIPSGTSSYEAVNEITVPADIDLGDYHFLIKVTDKEGWQTLKGISIKIK
jgi:hypothetical protein